MIHRFKALPPLLSILLLLSSGPAMALTRPTNEKDAELGTGVGWLMRGKARWSLDGLIKAQQIERDPNVERAVVHATIIAMGRNEFLPTEKAKILSYCRGLTARLNREKLGLEWRSLDGWLDYHGDNYATALRLFLSLNPDPVEHPGIHEAMGWLMISQGKFSQAAKTLKELSQSWGVSNESLLATALIAIHQGRNDAAVQMLSRYLWATSQWVQYERRRPQLKGNPDEAPYVQVRRRAIPILVDGHHPDLFHLNSRLVNSVCRSLQSSLGENDRELHRLLEIVIALQHGSHRRAFMLSEQFRLTTTDEKTSRWKTISMLVNPHANTTIIYAKSILKDTNQKSPQAWWVLGRAIMEEKHLTGRGHKNFNAIKKQAEKAMNQGPDELSIPVKEWQWDQSRASSFGYYAVDLQTNGFIEGQRERKKITRKTAQKAKIDSQIKGALGVGFAVLLLSAITADGDGGGHDTAGSGNQKYVCTVCGGGGADYLTNSPCFGCGGSGFRSFQ